MANNGGREMVEIPLDKYEQLLKDQHFLRCLESAGVDNWDGHYYAYQKYLEKYPDEDDF